MTGGGEKYIKSIRKLIGANMSKKYARQLENYLFPEGLPPYFPRYTKSPELLIIAHVLFNYGINQEVNKMDGFEDAINSGSSLEERLRLIINADNRSVQSYKALENFRIITGEHTPMAEIPLFQTVRRAREVRTGDLLLVRVDKKTLEKSGTVEVQVLTNGLFNSADDDFRCFTMTPLDFHKYSKYLKEEKSTNEAMEARRNDSNKSIKKARRRRSGSKQARGRKLTAVMGTD